jgi:hypothetical protein
MIPRLSCLALLLALLPASAVQACSIPVFRYALERWKPSPYEVRVFHRGPLPAGARALLRRLQRPAIRANLDVAVIDLAGKVKPAVRKVWEKEGRESPLPWVVVRYPESDDQTPPAWTGPLTAKAIARLLDSPLRRQVVRRLTAGESVVFVLLESGDRAAVAAARALLGKELPRLQKRIKLPEQSPEEPQLRSELPLRVALSQVRLTRSEPAEQALVRILLGSEDDLERVKGPIVFPVFGRGRVLGALHGKTLSARHLESAARYLCGACSCQVKEDNEGTDLLIAADWDALLDTPPRRASPPLPKPAIPPGLPAAPPSGVEPSSGSNWLWPALCVAGAVVVLTGLAIRRPRRAPPGLPEAEGPR